MTYKDKDDALAEYTSKMSGNADATMSALDGQNPLPASFAIEMDDPSKVESTAEKLKKVPISRRSWMTATSTRACCTARRQ